MYGIVVLEAHLPSHFITMQGRYTLQPWNEVANSAYSQPPVQQVNNFDTQVFGIRVHVFWGM